jgi:hypothetical protein
LVTGNLTLYYDFDQIVTNTEGEKEFVDKSGNGINGTIHEGNLDFDSDPGTLTVNNETKVRGAGAAQFKQSTVGSDAPVFVDAHGDVITEQFPDLLPTSGLNGEIGFSVAAWLNVTTNNVTDQSVFQGRTSDAGHGAPHFQLQGSGKFRMTFRNQTGGNVVDAPQVYIDGTVDSGLAYPVDEWFHYAGTYDAVDNLWVMYFNGDEIQSGGGTGEDLGNWGGVAGELFSAGFGAVYDSGGRRLDGLMDELYVFNRALSAQEIKTLATISATVPGDCDGDGLLTINDANCTADDKLDEFLASLGTLRGDADGDKQVQFPDFVILANNFDKMGTYTQGDFDKDGTVQFADFVLLANNFGKSVAATAAVPEPASGLLAVLAVCGLCHARQRRRRR